MKKMLVDSKTGEIIEAEEICPFASILDLKRDENDVERYKAGTSVTSLEGYEPLESIVARCMRTIVTPNGSTYQVLDKDALKAEETQQGIYEAAGAKTLDEAFATADPTDDQGFDFADASQIMNNISDVNTSDLSTQGTSVPSKSEVSDEVVGKSADVNTSEDFPEKKDGE